MSTKRPPARPTDAADAAAPAVGSAIDRAVDPANALSLTAPGLGRRMGAWLYEGMLMFAVVFVAGWLFSTLGQMRDAMDTRRPLLQAFLFIIFGIYFTWFWSRGQTLAMKTWNIRIVDRSTGRSPGQPRAALRYLLAWLWFLPPLVAIAPFRLPGGEIAVLLAGWIAVYALLSRFHPERQFLHDALAGTRLVDAPREADDGRSRSKLFRRRRT